MTHRKMAQPNCYHFFWTTPYLGVSVFPYWEQIGSWGCLWCALSTSSTAKTLQPQCRQYGMRAVVLHHNVTQLQPAFHPASFLLQNQMDAIFLISLEKLLPWRQVITVGVHEYITLACVMLYLPQNLYPKGSLTIDTFQLPFGSKAAHITCSYGKCIPGDSGVSYLRSIDIDIACRVLALQTSMFILSFHFMEVLLIGSRQR